MEKFLTGAFKKQEEAVCAKNVLRVENVNALNSLFRNAFFQTRTVHDGGDLCMHAPPKTSQWAPKGLSANSSSFSERNFSSFRRSQLLI
jgi:hypothetical protein